MSSSADHAPPVFDFRSSRCCFLLSLSCACFFQRCLWSRLANQAKVASYWSRLHFRRWTKSWWVTMYIWFLFLSPKTDSRPFFSLSVSFKAGIEAENAELKSQCEGLVCVNVVFILFHICSWRNCRTELLQIFKISWSVIFFLEKQWIITDELLSLFLF